MLTCHPWDADAGLFYFNARWYDADVGRFISEDPLWGSIFDPQSLNRFAYGRNNPYRYVDPTGMEIEGEYEDELGNSDAQDEEFDHDWVDEADDSKWAAWVRVVEKKQWAFQNTPQGRKINYASSSDLLEEYAKQWWDQALITNKVLYREGVVGGMNLVAGQVVRGEIGLTAAEIAAVSSELVPGFAEAVGSVAYVRVELTSTGVAAGSVFGSLEIGIAIGTTIDMSIKHSSPTHYDFGGMGRP